MASPRINIAMWSGPRNMSTTMMRSFGARHDTICSDEPFYAAWLKATGADHPLRAEILHRHENDPQRVAAAMIGPASNGSGRAIHYQKHMTHHMIPRFSRDWMDSVRNVFLIRHPARVLASYARKMEEVSLEAIGFPQQAELFDHVCAITGDDALVIDSDDILSDPPVMLAKLCAALDIAFDPAMLTWQQGRYPEDGAWAPHWYQAVWQSTGFGAKPGPLPETTDPMAAILEAALPIYRRLAAHRLRRPVSVE